MVPKNCLNDEGGGVLVCWMVMCDASDVMGHDRWIAQLSNALPRMGQHTTSKAYSHIFEIQRSKITLQT